MIVRHARPWLPLGKLAPGGFRGTELGISLVVVNYLLWVFFLNKKRAFGIFPSLPNMVCRVWLGGSRRFSEIKEKEHTYLFCFMFVPVCSGHLLFVNLWVSVLS